MDWLQALLIPLAGGTAYLLAFGYEAGFLAVFRVPIEFVKLNLSLILIVASALIVGLPILWWMIWLIMGGQHGILQTALVAGLLVIVAVALLFLYGQHGKEQFRFLLGATILTVALSVVVCVVFFRRQTVAQDAGIPWRTEMVLMVGLLFLVVGVLTSFAIGRRRALTQTHFLIPTDTPDLVVLRIYGDLLVCSPFDRNTRRAESTFVLRKASDGTCELKLEKIGPLVFPESSP